MLTLLANRLKEVRAIYNQAKKEKWTSPVPLEDREDPTCKYNTTLVEKTKKLFKPYLTDNVIISPLFYQSNSYTTWHIDGRDPEAILIVSYPNPVYLIDAEDKIQEEFYDRECHGQSRKNRATAIQTLINEGLAKLVIPKRGDIYLASGKTLHRTNPKANANEPHMCLRAWLNPKDTSDE